jgi:hypothetical protein
MKSKPFTDLGLRMAGRAHGFPPDFLSQPAFGTGIEGNRDLGDGLLLRCSV